MQKLTSCRKTIVDSGAPTMERVQFSTFCKRMWRLIVSNKGKIQGKKTEDKRETSVNVYFQISTADTEKSKTWFKIIKNSVNTTVQTASTRQLYQTIILGNSIAFTFYLTFIMHETLIWIKDTKLYSAYIMVNSHYFTNCSGIPASKNIFVWLFF